MGKNYLSEIAGLFCMAPNFRFVTQLRLHLEKKTGGKSIKANAYASKVHILYVVCYK